MGQPTGQSLRTCLLALGVAQEMGLGEPDLQDIFYLSLLRFVGCNAHAEHDAAVTGGNEMAFRRGMATVISGEPAELASHIVRNLGAGLPATTRVRLVAGAFAAGSKDARQTIAASCEVAQLIASRLGLSASLVKALGYSGEFWNGKGLPNGASAEAIPISSRIVNVARDVDVLSKVGGRQLAEDVLRKRRGRAYDPTVADAFTQHAWSIREGIEEGSLWDQVVEADPAVSIPLAGDRLTTYLTHTTLARCHGLDAISALACAHHERLDGSGYHRGVTGDQIPAGARILAAADAFKAMTSDRPWRPRFAPDEAARRLGAEVKGGKLGHDAVDAVLAAAGHAEQVPRQAWPAGLSDREVDVLKLISLGGTNREVAEKLFISPKTVGRHVENIYGKIGVTTRPAATLFAMQHHLLS